MTADELRARQAPLKEQYRQDPSTAQATLRVQGMLDIAKQACLIETGRGRTTEAGLHPLAGGDGTFACAADMLLESLVGCAGTTAGAVATAMNLPISAGVLVAEGDVDFRGTLGISRDVPVGFTAIRLRLEVETSADDAQLSKLGQLMERYCVVAQSLTPKPTVTVSRK